MADPIKSTDYTYEEARRTEVNVEALRERVRLLATVGKDLCYIVNEILADSTNPAHEGYREALEVHLAALDGEADGG